MEVALCAAPRAEVERQFEAALPVGSSFILDDHRVTGTSTRTSTADSSTTTSVMPPPSALDTVR